MIKALSPAGFKNNNDTDTAYWAKAVEQWRSMSLSEHNTTALDIELIQNNNTAATKHQVKCILLSTLYTGNVGLVTHQANFHYWRKKSVRPLVMFPGSQQQQ